MKITSFLHQNHIQAFFVNITWFVKLGCPNIGIFFLTTHGYGIEAVTYKAPRGWHE